MTQPRANRRSQDEWFQLIQECRNSGLSDRAWCEQHGIEPSDESAEFYYDETEIDMMERQLIDDENYGIWN